MYSKELILNAVGGIYITGKKLSDYAAINEVITSPDEIKIIFQVKDDSEDIMELIKVSCKEKLSETFEVPKENVKVIFTQTIDNQVGRNKDGIKNVKNIILIASGKGGVGKSTVASILALAFAKSGLKIGLLDADMYGPSIPQLFGVNMKPEVSADNKLLPIIIEGLKIISMGFLVGQEKALIWRGPMLAKALFQLTHGVEWGGQNEELDILFIDTPPGTGDIHLSLASKYKIDGVIFISTPQVLALNDTIKSIAMFKELQIPIIGLIDNMSYFISGNRQEHFIFGQNTVRAYCEAVKMNFLGSVPINKLISDDKSLIVNYSEIENIFKEVLENLKHDLLKKKL